VYQDDDYKQTTWGQQPLYAFGKINPPARKAVPPTGDLLRIQRADGKPPLPSPDRGIRSREMITGINVDEHQLFDQIQRRYKGRWP
jgi:hypothetical protein